MVFRRRLRAVRDADLAEDALHVVLHRERADLERRGDVDIGVAAAHALEDIRRSEEHACTEGHPFVIVAEGRAIGRVGLNNFRPRDGLASLYIFVGDKDVQRTFQWLWQLGADIGRRARHREMEDESGALAWLALNVNRAAVPLNNSVNHSQAQSGATVAFGGKKGLQALPANVFGHTSASVA